MALILPQAQLALSSLDFKEPSNPRPTEAPRLVEPCEKTASAFKELLASVAALKLILSLLQASLTLFKLGIGHPVIGQLVHAVTLATLLYSISTSAADLDGSMVFLMESCGQILFLTSKEEAMASPLRAPLVVNSNPSDLLPNSTL